MLKQILTTFIVSVLALTLSACQTSPTSEDTGRVVGGVLGGVLGSQVGSGSGKTAAIIAGTLIGVYIGGAIGKTMDDNDRRNAYDALENNRTNQPASWRNPDSGNEYTVTPTKTYTASSGPCREYTTEVVIDGKRETAYGTACRENGSWRVVN